MVRLLGHFEVLLTDKKRIIVDAYSRYRISDPLAFFRRVGTEEVLRDRFGKIIKQVKKFYVHDEEGKAQVGDTVRIMETRPISKLKRWRLVEILKH